MSEYHELKTEYKDRDCLVEALNDAGYKTVEVSETPLPLYDYTGRQTHYLDKTGDKANVIVRRKYIGGMPNDLGFAKQADGTYSAIVSDYDSSKHNKGWFNNLRKSYVEKVDIKTAAKQGFKFLRKENVGKKVVLRFLDTRA